jgi:hypothetical protein
MWIWQLIIRRAKKVTIPLNDKNCTPVFTICSVKKRKSFQSRIGRASATSSERNGYLAPSVSSL